MILGINPANYSERYLHEILTQYQLQKQSKFCWMALEKEMVFQIKRR